MCREGTILKYYKLDLDLFLETDASGKGIGHRMDLLQSENNEKESLYPITYDSKTLTPTEMRYANIERIIRVIGALEKFHYFTFGHPVTVLTDHKPLLAIAKKALINPPPSPQRLFTKVEQLQCNLRVNTW